MPNKKNRMIIRDAAGGHWLKFETPLRIFKILRTADIIAALDEIDYQVNHLNRTAAGFISYEAAAAFDPAFKTRHSEGFPLLYFGIYKEAEILDVRFDKPQIETALNPTAEISESSYLANIDNIKKRIAHGHTYQTNYTFRLRTKTSVEPSELFKIMIHSGQARYGAFIDTEDFAVCSASPELFFRLDGDIIRTLPMKGTAARGKSLKEDEQNRSELANSPKNRAENVMIVDMIRNDLSRICDYGSVRVSELFRIEKYPTVWQMISEVKGRTQAGLSALFSALFPCASITGAPKISTMAIIKELETSPRKIYTGSIGFLMPKRKAQFNVAIRTMLIDKQTQEIEYGIGGGIVWESSARDEYEEALLKAQVILKTNPEFELLETMRVDKTGKIFLLDYHIKRIKDSARYFDYAFDEILIRKRLREESSLPEKSPFILRMLLNRAGEIRFERSLLINNSKSTPIKIDFAKSAIDNNNIFLYHKTTRREVYEQAKAEICEECDDAILWNKNGEITESTIANIVIRRNGIYYTPPIGCGLLGGTLRQYLLDKGKIIEKKISKEELLKSDAVFLINSVREWRRAVINKN